MAENIYNWQYNTIPGNANQGAVLMTRNDITQPPFNQTDFIWKAMEDVFGVSNVKLEYDEPNNKFHIYKTKGHLDNEGNWSYNWEEFGSWDALTDEVAEVLKNLVFVEYIYDTSVPNALKVYGKKKDSTLVELCDITFAAQEYVDQLISQLETTLNNEITRSTAKDTELETNLNNEITRATNKDNDLQAQITANEPKAGTAIDIQDNNGKVISVKYDNDSIKVNNSGNLAADVFKDTEVSNTKGWSSAKISQEITSGVHYRGQVESYQFLPTTAQQGDMYNVADTGDNYVWSGTNWDKMSGDYIAGPGIDITGKVISASGIAFGTGNGLTVNQTTGNLETSIDDNTIKFDSQGKMYADTDVSQKVGTRDPLYSYMDSGVLKIGLGIGNMFKVSENDGLLLNYDPNVFEEIINQLSIKVSDGLQKTANGIAAKFWTGTQAEYDAISTKDSTTIYMIHE